MKKIMITCFEDEYAVHEHIGGGAYRAVFFGSHNEVVQFLRDNQITDYAIGF